MLSIESGQAPANLSEQELVDCSRGYGNGGCNGGLMNLAYDYIKDNKLAIQENYSYTARDQQCSQQKKGKSPRIAIQGYKMLQQPNVDGLSQMLESGPVTIAIHVQSDFMQYKRGIYRNDNCGTQPNHSVLVTAQGSQDGQEYYLIKNSWGARWGE